MHLRQVQLTADCGARQQQARAGLVVHTRCNGYKAVHPQVGLSTHLLGSLQVGQQGLCPSVLVLSVACALLELPAQEVHVPLVCLHQPVLSKPSRDPLPLLHSFSAVPCKRCCLAAVVWSCSMGGSVTLRMPQHRCASGEWNQR